MIVTSEKELGTALNNNEDTIEIQGDLAKKVIRIKATGTAAWIVAIGAIGVAVAITVSTVGGGLPGSAITGGAAVVVLGLPATVSAVAIAVAAGGVGALNTLRKYRIADKSVNSVTLKR